MVGAVSLSPQPVDGEPATVSADDRATEPHHDAILSSQILDQQIPCRHGRWKLVPERQNQLRRYTSGPSLVGKCTVATGNVTRATRSLASYHCPHISKKPLQRVQERTESVVKNLGRDNTALDQWSSTRSSERGKTKYRRGHTPEGDA